MNLLGFRICEESPSLKRRLPRHCPKARKNLASTMASTSLKGEEDLSVRLWCLNVAQGRGGLISPVLGVLRAPEYFGTKVTLWCPRPWRDLNNGTVLFMECLKHQGSFALIFLRLVPTPEERSATATPYPPQGV